MTTCRGGVRSLAALLPFAAAFAALFWPTFAWMAERFRAVDSFYAHGWFIPAAAGWLIWQRRRQLNADTARGSFQGLVLLIPALVVHVSATWWHVGFVSGIAMVCAVWGLVWTLWGWRTLRVLRFPMLFLLFMVPLPSILLLAASFRMKLLAAGAATQLLNALGLAVRQVGSTLFTPTMTILVDDTCSGLRSLISLIALSTFWASLLPSSAAPRCRWLLVAAAIPIALAANIVRILMVVWFSALCGTAMVQRFADYGSGLVAFGVALLALGWLGQRLAGRAAAASSEGDTHA